MKKVISIVLCALLLAAMSGCGGGEGGEAVMNAVYPEGIAYDDTDALIAIRQENEVDETFLAGLAEFAYESAAELLKNNGENKNYSPLSLYYALALAASGAGGQTAEELFSLLGLTDADYLSEQCGRLFRRLYTDNEVGSLRIANSLWLDSEVGGEEISFKEEFLNRASESFYASLYEVDFSESATASLMFRWIADNTKSTLEPEISLDPNQMMSIINAVYFCDQWLSSFSESATASDSFTLADSSTISCDFMNRTDSSGSYATGEGYTRASLALKNRGTMVFVLPDEGLSPYALIENLGLRELLEGGEYGSGEVVWKLPKFSFDSKFELAETLKTLGVSSAFDESADFSGISDAASFISDIRQETHIAVDEMGVEASAYTQIDFATSSLPAGRAEMLLDRPFIFAIMTEGVPLFIGVCENPTA
ncbi:MAG: serpin family protein [Oscillospiraceae bacterium]|nr:serpin family protein [Oscillospiraceae bacterium]